MSRTEIHYKNTSATWVYCNGKKGRRPCKEAATLTAAINAGWRLAAPNAREPQDYCPKCPAPIVPFAKPTPPPPLAFTMYRAPAGKTLHPVEEGASRTMCNRPLPATWVHADPAAEPIPMCDVCALQVRVAVYRAYRDGRSVEFR